MLVGLEGVFNQVSPDWILTYGDTNSTVAAALAAVKMNLRVAHLEAGLRSGNRLMPEEHNRVITDHVSDLLLAPTQTAMRHLAVEGLSGRARLVGDVMADVCFRVLKSVNAQAPTMPANWRETPQTVLATIHRAENTDDPLRLAYILDRMDSLSTPIMLVAHPRLIAKARDYGLSLERTWITPIPSMDYTRMIFAVSRALCVITDSGGLQKEAFLLGTPCVTARHETEWPETLQDAWNIVDPQLQFDLQAHVNRKRQAPDVSSFGSGHAAERVVDELENWSQQ
jgi:UDP-N-acetylglucosamine 2-epimerase (non-hydrolysing)